MDYTSDPFDFGNGYRFRYEMPSLLVACGAVATYVVLVTLVLPTVVKQFPGLSASPWIRRLLVLHSALQSLLSLVFLIGLAGSVFWLAPQLDEVNSFKDLVCEQSTFEQTDWLQFFIYWTYLSKFWEFLDTVFIVLRGKPTTFLHVYHHSATPLLAVITMRGHVPIIWFPAVLNMAVHFVMYGYYAVLAYNPASKLRQWKHWITRMQILQFVLILACILFALLAACFCFHYPGGPAEAPCTWENRWVVWYVLTHGSLPPESMGRVGCGGTLEDAALGVGIIFSYLILFARFYFQLRSSRQAAAAAKRDVAKKKK